MKQPDIFRHNSNISLDFPSKSTELQSYYIRINSTYPPPPSSGKVSQFKLMIYEMRMLEIVCA